MNVGRKEGRSDELNQVSPKRLKTTSSPFPLNHHHRGEKTYSLPLLPPPCPIDDGVLFDSSEESRPVLLFGRILVVLFFPPPRTFDPSSFPPFNLLLSPLPLLQDLLHLLVCVLPYIINTNNA